MRAGHSLLAFLGYSTLAAADPVTITMGNRADYSHAGTAAATPTGDNIALEGTGDLQDGIDIYLSPELQTKIKNIVKLDCENQMGSKCYNQVRDLFDEPETGLITRNPLLLRLAAVGGISAILFPVLYEDTQPSVIHVPIKQLNEATKLPKATKIVLIPEKGSTITIDPSPEPTATGLGTATVTTYTASASDHAKGDVGIIIPEGLAKDLNNYLNKKSISDCEDGSSFKNRKLRLRSSGLSGTVCGTESVLANGAIAAELLHVIGTQVAPRINAGDAVRAMNTAITYLRENSEFFDVTPEQANRLAEFIYPLVWLKMVQNEDIKAVNVISSKDVDTNDPKTTKTDCTSKTTATNCNVGCGFIGPIIGCTTTCSETEACTSTTGTITTTKVVAWTPAVSRPAKLTPTPTPKCNDDISGFPANLFKDGIYSKFCGDLKDTTKEQKWKVDSSGNQVKEKRRGVEMDLIQRTPPASAKNYADYYTTLQFKPKKNGGVCQQDCSSAYALIVDGPCGRTASEMNIMASEGSVDVGCGTYSYSISVSAITATSTAAKSSPTLSGRNCHNKKEIKGDVHPRAQTAGAAKCINYKGEDGIMRKGKGPVSWTQKDGGVTLQYMVSWINGCEGDEQNWAHPHGDTRDTPLGETCYLYLWEDYDKCTGNQGGGGSIDYGCVRYDFTPR